jgi:hypothetical protein
MQINAVGLTACVSIRHLLARANSPRVMSLLKQTLDKINTHGFRVESIEPRYAQGLCCQNVMLMKRRPYRIKDGGAFVKFKYTKRAEEAKAEGEKPTERPSLEADIKKQVKDAGGIRTWLGNATGEVWLVRGKPWREVCPVVFGRATAECSLGHETICCK